MIVFGRITGKQLLTSILFISILIYPMTLEGRRGTTDESATIPFHLFLFPAALVELAKSIPVHYLTLSSHLFFFLPLFPFPVIVPCRMSLLNQKTLKHGQTILASVLDQGQEFVIFSNSCFDLSANLLIGNMVLIRNVLYPPVASHLKSLRLFL